MSLPRSRSETVDGVRVEASSFKHNHFADPVDADRIEIGSRHFSRIDGTSYLIEAAGHLTACRDDAAPSTVPDLLPPDGVFGNARVELDGNVFNFETATGAYPRRGGSRWQT